MAAKESVTATPTALEEAFLLASGVSSANPLQTMAPAAMPNPTGRKGSNASTTRNDGTAMIGCGRLVKMLQRAACQTGVPRGAQNRPVGGPPGVVGGAKGPL